MKKRLQFIFRGKKDGVTHYCDAHADNVEGKEFVKSTAAVCVVKEHVCDFCEPAKTAKE
jgi:hypothetical protein